MAITSITIENFKCIGDAVTIPIRPITLLFGKNSAGKSTVLSAIRYLNKICDNDGGFGGGFSSGSGRSDGDGFGGGFGSGSGRSNGDGFGGGSDDGLEHKEIDPYLWTYWTTQDDFSSLVHRQERGRKIRIRLDFDINSERLKRTKPKSAWIEIITGWDKKQQTITEEIVGLDKHRLLSDSNEKDKIKNIVLEELRSLRHLGPIRTMEPLQDFTDSMSESARQEMLQVLNNSMSESARWKTGLAAWDALNQDPKLVEKTNHYMKKLALGYSLRRSEDGNPKIKLYDENHKIDVQLSDVGTGISQIIPVVVGALDDTSQIFAVEQPELHVHPAVQVALGDLFVDGIKNSNRTMLIETHSEHLLLRLLRRVRETNVRNSKKYEWRQSSMPPLHREMSEAAIRDAEYQDSKDHQLTPDDLSVIYVQPTPEGVKFTPLAVTNDGDFNAPWPEGFFDERVEELL